MPDFAALPTAEAVGSLGSLMVIIFVAVTLLTLWQVAIYLTDIVRGRLHKDPQEDLGNVA